MKFLYFPVLDSTNNKAKELLQLGEQNNFVVVADEQTEGRGQQGKTWESPNGGLYLTVVIKWEEKFKINLTSVPLAFGELVSWWCKKNFGFQPQIKWPNDLYFSGCKLSGVLCEKFKNHILVGIGLNLNQKPLKNAVSVSAVKNKSINVQRAQKSFFEYLEKHSKSIFESVYIPTWSNYQKAWLSQSKKIHLAKAISPDGALELTSTDTKPFRLFSADHSFDVFSHVIEEMFYVILDIGNSRIKASLFSNKSDKIQGYDVGVPAEISEIMLGWQSRYDVQLVVSISVNGESFALLKKQISDSFYWLELSKFLPYLNTKYLVSQIGLDRLAAMEAAGFLVGRQKPMVVVSAGTAMTVDLISHDFQHLGGYICAGLGLKLEALSGCSLLPKVDLPQQSSTALPTKTNDALAYGAVHESVAFIQNMLASLSQNQVGDVELVLTGGDAPILKSYFPDATHEEKLITIGGNLMFRGGYLHS